MTKIDGCGDLLLEGAQGFQAIHPRQADVQQHQVRAQLARRGQPLLAAACALGGVACVGQAQRNAAAHQSVIVYHQNSCHTLYCASNRGSHQMAVADAVVYSE